MKIPVNIVGLELDPRSYEIGWRQTTNFAAAVGDYQSRYLDDSRADGLQVHPVFPVTLSWPIIAGIGQQLEGLVPAEALLRMVHAYERISWHSRLKPGDRIELQGRIVSLGPTSAGALVVIRIEAYRPDRQPIYSEDIGGLFRDVECEAQGSDPMIEQAAGPGARPPAWSDVIAVPAAASFVYDGCSEIVFPIHTSESFARAVGLPGIVLQGTCALAMAISRLLREVTGGDPVPVRELACRFRKPILPGTRVRLEVWLQNPKTAGERIAFRVINPNSRTAIDQGFVSLAERE